MSTLRYANRAKNIKNKPRINQDPKDALLRQYQDEITQLKQLLEQQKAEESNSTITAQPVPQLVDMEAEKEKIREEYEQQLQALRQSYETEKKSYAKLQADVENLKGQYEKELDEVKEEKNQLLEEKSLSPEQAEALAR